VTSARLALRTKRAIDVVGAALALVVLLPLLAAIAMALLVLQGRPVLFRQVRPGRGGRPFSIVKFRTMRPPREDEIGYLTDGDRVTRIGRFLRAGSLDELPELWNVLRGEMSLVGPRPLLMEFLDQYTPEQRRRHDVTPGITGWAAVNGRHAIRFEERMALDVWYVDHWSLWVDFRILARTVVHVIRRTDVSATEDVDLGFPLPPPSSPRAAPVPAVSAHAERGARPAT
jgi:lipopolysaccharide/colanic/teichoic acid biosynthesis glycosyltransferase